MGIVRLAGKDVDLFRLWAVVQQAGSGQKVRPGPASPPRNVTNKAQLNQINGWSHILSHFDLPEQFMHSNAQPQPTALALQQYYSLLLGPFEDIYRKNIARERAAAAARNQAGQMPGTPSRPGSMSGVPGGFPLVGTSPVVDGYDGS